MRNEILLIAVAALVGSVLTLLLTASAFVKADCDPSGCAEAPCCNGDCNGDKSIDIADAVYLLGYLFAGGPEPVPRRWPNEVALFGTNQTVCYDLWGGEIDCENEEYPGQDAFHGTGVEHSYTDNGDGTITDDVTGLMWAKAPAQNRMNWQEALQHCDESILAGYDDWRLPNIKELHSLALYDRAMPSIDPAFELPVQVWEDWVFWSCSSWIPDPRRAYFVMFRGGAILSDMPECEKTRLYRVRAVRTAQAVD